MTSNALGMAAIAVTVEEVVGHLGLYIQMVGAQKVGILIKVVWSYQFLSIMLVLLRLMLGWELILSLRVPL
jgi:hypothetical protein